MERSLLIVEDDRDQRETFTRWFIRAGYHVTAVHHPRLALAAAHSHPFQVALVNQSLPEMSGTELMRRLQGVLSGVQVVLLSYQPENTRKRCSDGPFATVVKPCPKATLEALVDEAFEQQAAGVAVPESVHASEAIIS